MSWKAVELQVALPRTQDASQLQDQMNQRGQLTQEQLAQSQIKQAELKRKRVLETKNKDKIRHDEDSDHGSNQESFTSNKKNQPEDEPSEKHPYLGKIIDYSG
ncbi:hypothetical protein [Tenuibacillus multivorans]|uniref:Uncharacterized protein n=1 Tax=Tenuibacillus multivorans TaxID=237069 RepID=A0A1G9XWY7_9BACI|nr:hypothetical protein [Tenuibacillus multivorans]GEL75851.1 hypothetical protein TMU01_00860 [Tenuibacillus multivorans]SDN01284.1 hypothetical protein SAMN05216498_1144 [Tenuibacillus multivorans]